MLLLPMILHAKPKTHTGQHIFSIIFQPLTTAYIVVLHFPIVSVKKVIDGDSVRVVLDRGWSDFSTKDIRIMGIDAPERFTEAGKLVSQCVQGWVGDGDGLWLVSSQLDKYGRVLGNLYRGCLASEEDTLESFLLSYGLARPYKGGRRPKWIKSDLFMAQRRAEECLATLASDP